MSAFDIGKESVRIATTHGLSKEVIDLLEKKAALLTQEIESLRSEVLRLEADNSVLRARLPNDQRAGFVENDGLLWKRIATGGFELRPYCPQCVNRPVMMGFPPGRPDSWVCPENHTFDFTSRPPSA